MNEDHYAVVIGIKDYPLYGRNRNKDIEAAHQDADAVYQWLTDPNGGGVPKQNVIKILSWVSEEIIIPEQNTIDRALEKLRNSIAPEGGTRCYFYFSGHGVAKRRKDTQLCMATWNDSSWISQTISSGLYGDAISDGVGFEELIVWLDCCRVYKSTVDENGPGLSYLPQPKANFRFLEAYACEFSQSAYFNDFEYYDGELGRTRSRSLFTKALLEGLRGGCMDEEGNVQAQALKDFIEYRVEELAQQMGEKQTAQLEGSYVGDWVLCSVAPDITQKVLFRFDGREGAVRLLDGNCNSIEYDFSESPQEVELPLGDYALHGDDGSRIDFSVYAYPQESLLIDFPAEVTNA